MKKKIDQICIANNLLKYELYNLLLIARRSVEKSIVAGSDFSPSLSQRIYHLTGDKKYEKEIEDQNITCSRYLVFLWRKWGMKSIPKEFLMSNGSVILNKKEDIVPRILKAIEDEKWNPDIPTNNHETLVNELINLLTAEFEQGKVPHFTDYSVILRLTNLLVCYQKDDELKAYQLIRTFNS